MMRGGMLLFALLASWAAHADSWVARYAQLRPEVQRACNEHDLVTIQNGTVPERIVVIRLNRALDRVDSWGVLLARAPGLGDPTHGCLRHGEFYFIANSGWDQFEDDGARVASVVPTAPEIWRIRVPSLTQHPSPGVPTQNR